MNLSRIGVYAFVGVMAMTTVSAKPAFPPFPGNPFTEMLSMVQQIRDAVIGDGTGFSFPTFFSGSDFGKDPIPFDNSDSGSGNPFIPAAASSSFPPMQASSYGFENIPYSSSSVSSGSSGITGIPSIPSSPNGFDIPPYNANPTANSDIPSMSAIFNSFGTPFSTGPDATGVASNLPTPGSFNGFGTPSFANGPVGPIPSIPANANDFAIPPYFSGLTNYGVPPSSTFEGFGIPTGSFVPSGVPSIPATGGNDFASTASMTGTSNPDASTFGQTSAAVPKEETGVISE